MKWILGTELTPELQRHALARFVHRYTAQNVPQWARGSNYKPQFADDADWLAHSYFPVTKTGRLAIRPSHCNSHPTWPQGKGVWGQKGIDW